MFHVLLPLHRHLIWFYVWNMYTPITERKAAATNIAVKVLVSLECHTSIIWSFFDGFTYSFLFFSQPGLHCTPLRQRMSLMLLKEQQSLIASHCWRQFIQCRNKVKITPPCLLKCNAWWKGHWEPCLAVVQLLLQTGVCRAWGKEVRSRQHQTLYLYQSGVVH